MPQDVESFYERRAGDIGRLKRSTYRRVSASALAAFLEQRHPRWEPSVRDLVARLWGNQPEDVWVPEIGWLETIVDRLAAIDNVKAHVPDWETEVVQALAVEWVGNGNKLWKQIWPIRMSRLRPAGDRTVDDSFRAFVPEARDIYESLLGIAYSHRRELLTFGRHVWSGDEPVRVAGLELRIASLSLLESGYTTYEADAMARYRDAPTTLRHQREMTGFLRLVSDDDRFYDLPVSGTRHKDLLRLHADFVLVEAHSADDDGSTSRSRRVLDSLRRAQGEQRRAIRLRGRLKPEGLETEIVIEPSALDAVLQRKNRPSAALPEDFPDLPLVLVGRHYTRQAVLQIMGPPDGAPRSYVVGLLSLYDHFRRGRGRDCALMEEYHYTLLGQVEDNSTILFHGISWQEYSPWDVQRLRTLGAPIPEGIRTPEGGLRVAVGVTELPLRIPQRLCDATTTMLRDIPVDGSEPFEYPIRFEAMQTESDPGQDDDALREELFSASWKYFKFLEQRPR